MNSNKIHLTLWPLSAYCSWFAHRVLKQDHNHSGKEIYLLTSMGKQLHQTIHESIQVVPQSDKYHYASFKLWKQWAAIKLCVNTNIGPLSSSQSASVEQEKEFSIFKWQNQYWIENIKNQRLPETEIFLISGLSAFFFGYPALRHHKWSKFSESLEHLLSEKLVALRYLKMSTKNCCIQSEFALEIPNSLELVLREDLVLQAALKILGTMHSVCFSLTLADLGKHLPPRPLQIQ